MIHGIVRLAARVAVRSYWTRFSQANISSVPTRPRCRPTSRKCFRDTDRVCPAELSHTYTYTYAHPCRRIITLSVTFYFVTYETSPEKRNIYGKPVTFGHFNLQICKFCSFFMINYNYEIYKISFPY